jgi:hypothetical protein
MENINLTDAHRELLYGFSLQQGANITRLRMYDGHNIFRYSILEDTLIRVAMERKGSKIKFEYMPGHIYFFCLNKHSAEDKLNKLFKDVDDTIKSQLTLDKPLATASSLSMGVGENIIDKSINTE